MLSAPLTEGFAIGLNLWTQLAGILLSRLCDALMASLIPGKCKCKDCKARDYCDRAPSEA